MSILKKVTSQKLEHFHNSDMQRQHFSMQTLACCTERCCVFVQPHRAADAAADPQSCFPSQTNCVSEERKDYSLVGGVKRKNTIKEINPAFKANLESCCAKAQQHFSGSHLMCIKTVFLSAGNQVCVCSLRAASLKNSHSCIRSGQCRESADCFHAADLNMPVLFGCSLCRRLA